MMAGSTAGSDGISHPSAGRPRVNVDRSHVQFLRGLHFTWSEISSILNVSVKTIQRRAKDWNFTTYTDISDDALDTTISEILAQLLVLLSITFKVTISNITSFFSKK